MTIKIQGKEYMMVNERIKEFRKNFPNHSLETEIIEITIDRCLLRAVIRDELGVIIATGIAQEFQNDTTSFVNKDAYVENCETSAWGRALGCLGVGIDISIASADEVGNKMSYEKEAFPPEDKLIEFLKKVKNPRVYYRDVKTSGYSQAIINEATSIMYPKGQ